MESESAEEQATTEGGDAADRGHPPCRSSECVGRGLSGPPAAGDRTGNAMAAYERCGDPKSGTSGCERRRPSEEGDAHISLEQPRLAEQSEEQLEEPLGEQAESIEQQHSGEHSGEVLEEQPESIEQQQSGEHVEEQLGERSEDSSREQLESIEQPVLLSCDPEVLQRVKEFVTSSAFVDGVDLGYLPRLDKLKGEEEVRSLLSLVMQESDVPAVSELAMAALCHRHLLPYLKSIDGILSGILLLLSSGKCARQVQHASLLLQNLFKSGVAEISDLLDEQQFALFIGGLVHRVEIEEMRNLLYQVVDDRRLHQRLSAARLFPCLWEAMGCGKEFRGEEVRCKRAFIELMDTHGQTRLVGDVIVNVMSTCRAWDDSELLVELLSSKEMAELLLLGPTSGWNYVYIDSMALVLTQVMLFIYQQGQRVQWPFLSAVLGDLDKLSALLVVPNALLDTESVEYSFGVLSPPFGFARLHLVELFATLSYTGVPEVPQRLAESGVFQHALVRVDALVRYQWNNILHHLILELFVAFLDCADDRCILRVFEATRVLEVAIVVVESDSSSGSQGHLIALCNEIEKLANLSVPVAMALQENEAWVAFSKTTLRRIRELERTPLSTFHSYDEDDEDSFDQLSDSESDEEEKNGDQNMKTSLVGTPIRGEYMEYE